MPLIRQRSGLFANHPVVTATTAASGGVLLGAYLAMQIFAAPVPNDAKVPAAGPVAETRPEAKPSVKQIDRPVETTQSAPAMEAAAAGDPCETQSWPYLTRECAEQMQKHRPARVVTTDRVQPPASETPEPPRTPSVAAWPAPATPADSPPATTAPAAPAPAAANGAAPNSPAPDGTQPGSTQSPPTATTAPSAPAVKPAKPFEPAPPKPAVAASAPASPPAAQPVPPQTPVAAPAPARPQEAAANEPKSASKSANAVKPADAGKYVGKSADSGKSADAGKSADIGKSADAGKSAERRKVKQAKERARKQERERENRGEGDNFAFAAGRPDIRERDDGERDDWASDTRQHGRQIRERDGEEATERVNRAERRSMRAASQSDRTRRGRLVSSRDEDGEEEVFDRPGRRAIVIERDAGEPLARSRAFSTRDGGGLFGGQFGGGSFGE